MPTQLSLHDLTKSHDHRLVLDQITCAFPPGQVSGLIGENGSGKSTLLRIAAGVESPTDGSVLTAGSIGFLAQDNPLPLHHDVAALADLDEYAGALVVVSHDRRFNSRWRGGVRDLKEPSLVCH